MNRNFFKAVLVVGAIALAACSSEPAKTTEAKTEADTAAKKAAGPPEPVLAKTAFYEMYTPAHAWAADLLPISLKSGEYSVIDGPFTEAKELVGGWALMECRDLAEAVEWSKRFLGVLGEGEVRVRPVM